ncbi:hypothetical protein TNCV_1648561 [Trichonephila clavipes]|uniref:Uncharacterized protein n=1 Tax=Trichonephila clavipes TaxID=2585209 RepID=A0A8X6RK42_TRICX|nr:hypothetical protein TNCV_1648561 [Trichonephila clavipes]
MNSPDYDDFIDMFSVPTPFSPLPPPPVASPSHEPFQDVIYDSLPPMEQSAVSGSPLKDSVDFKPPLVSKSPIVSKLPDPPAKRPMSRRLIPSFIVLRDPGKDGMKNEGMRKDRMRNEGHEIPGCLEDPI